MAVCLKEETLQAYFDGELASDRSAEVLKHLAGCGACAARARETERVLALIDDAFEVELPGAVPTASLRARVEEGLASTRMSKRTDAIAGLSDWRLLYHSFGAWLHPTQLPARRLGFATACVLVAIALVGGLGYWQWRTAPSKSNGNVVGHDHPHLLPQTPPDQKLAQ